METSYTETGDDGSSTDTQLGEKDSTYDSIDDDLSEEISKKHTPLTNFNPDNCVFRITDGMNVMNSDGKIYADEGGTALSWSASNIDYDGESDKTVLISLVKKGKDLGVDVNSISYAVVDAVGVNSKGSFSPVPNLFEYSDWTCA